MPHLALYPGSFDPITYGHLDVIIRGRTLFDELIVAVGRNPGKDPLFSPDERVEMVQALIADMIKTTPKGAPVSVRPFAGLTVDFARQVNATVLLRGGRTVAGLRAEVQQAAANRELPGPGPPFVVAGQSSASPPSSLIKQITAMGDDL